MVLRDIYITNLRHEQSIQRPPIGHCINWIPEYIAGSMCCVQICRLLGDNKRFNLVEKGGNENGGLPAQSDNIRLLIWVTVLPIPCVLKIGRSSDRDDNQIAQASRSAMFGVNCLRSSGVHASLGL